LLELKDGRVLEARIDHCRGSQARPMSDADLDEKFRGQAALGVKAGRVDGLLAACWGIGGENAVGAFVRHWFGGG